jgi:hypothetical protein
MVTNFVRIAGAAKYVQDITDTVAGNMSIFLVRTDGDDVIAPAVILDHLSADLDSDGSFEAAATEDISGHVWFDGSSYPVSLPAYSYDV